MTELNRAAAPAMSPPKRLVRLAGWCAYASGIVSIFGIIFLVTFFTVGSPFGKLNDIAVIVQYVLMLPIAITLYQFLRPYGPRLSLFALLIGVAGMLAVIVLQLLLVTGVLPFGQQIGMVIVAFLVVVLWFVMNGRLGRTGGILPKSILLNVLAGLYFAYPFWAFSVGRRLQSQ
jgi:hypothetical protein